MLFAPAEIAGLVGIALAVIVIALFVTRLDQRIGDAPEARAEDNDDSET